MGDLAVLPALRGANGTAASVASAASDTGNRASSASRAPSKVHEAAQQFEALLLGQMLRAERESGSGWLSGGEDSSAECVTDYAEQQFAAILAQNGGLGIATLVAKGLTSGR